VRNAGVAGRLNKVCKGAHVPQIYRIFGSELSPYSVKVRSYFRLKGIDHEWIVRGPDNMEVYQQYARLPLIPLVITPDDEGWQDSTPIIERMEAAHPEPRLDPTDESLGFISALIEEFADEWMNKPMFHYRWTYEPDQISTARRIAASSMGAKGAALDEATEKVRIRMVPRLSFVGSSPATTPLIEASYRRVLEILDNHFAHHDYLLGSRPALADLGLFAQLYESSTDPTPGAIMRKAAPRVPGWISCMLDPDRRAVADDGFATWDALGPTLSPLLREQVAGIFFPWSVANAAAIEAGEESFSVKLAGETFSQAPQKYHARSLAAIRAKYAAVADKSALDPILEDTGCRQFLI